ncbi:hypothetical protein DL771_010907 [Monosporascus sp. 5C6A]|nr:hypothetical protein DL771_010907 [Monosporascus sp. 5C6A]
MTQLPDRALPDGRQPQAVASPLKEQACGGRRGDEICLGRNPRYVMPEGEVQKYGVSSALPDCIQPMRYRTMPTDMAHISVGICGFPYGMPKDKNGTHNAHPCCSDSRVMYEPMWDLVYHGGDTKVGISHGSVVADNNTVISVDRDWTDFKYKHG